LSNWAEDGVKPIDVVKAIKAEQELAASPPSHQRVVKIEALRDLVEMAKHDKTFAKVLEDLKKNATLKAEIESYSNRSLTKQELQKLQNANKTSFWRKLAQSFGGASVGQGGGYNFNFVFNKGGRGQQQQQQRRPLNVQQNPFRQTEPPQFVDPTRGRRPFDPTIPGYFPPTFYFEKSDKGRDSRNYLEEALRQLREEKAFNDSAGNLPTTNWRDFLLTHDDLYGTNTGNKANSYGDYMSKFSRGAGIDPNREYATSGNLAGGSLLLRQHLDRGTPHLGGAFRR
jgi:hypothetical protein